MRKYMKAKPRMYLFGNGNYRLIFKDDVTEKTEFLDPGKHRSYYRGIGKANQSIFNVFYMNRAGVKTHYSSILPMQPWTLKEQKPERV